MAIIFDVDGTLIDNNMAHVEAWRRALLRYGLRVSRARIQPEIGKGGDLLVPSLLGEQLEAELGEQLRTAHREEYLTLARRLRFPLTEGALALLGELRRAAIPTAVATSSAPEVLAATLQSACLDLEVLVDVFIDQRAGSTSKPAPDLVDQAARALGVERQRLFLVGDTVHDAGAAARAGVGFIGLTCGGSSRDALVTAGALAVFCDPAELLMNLSLFLPSAPPGIEAPRH